MLDEHTLAYQWTKTTSKFCRCLRPGAAKGITGQAGALYACVPHLQKLMARTTTAPVHQEDIGNGDDPPKLQGAPVAWLGRAIHILEIRQNGKARADYCGLFSARAK
jgi:hypothetical protein